jgi:hypothetical protein
MKTQSPVKRSLPKVSERASDDVLGNYYVTIGLSRNQRALLTEVGRRWGSNKAPCAEAARQLVMLGLSNLSLMVRIWEIHEKYCQREDLFFTHYLDRLAAHTLKEMTHAMKR